MRTPLVTTAIALAMLATAACNKTDANNSMATDANLAADAASNDVLGANGMAATPMAAADFGTMIAGSDMYEIESGKLAQTMATSADLKAFGAMLVTDHTKSSAMLKDAANKSSPSVLLPVKLPADLQAKIDALKAAKGADFDRLFIDQQTAGHQMALDALKNFSTGGDSAPLKAFATTAIPVVSAHLDKLNGMKK